MRRGTTDRCWTSPAPASHAGAVPTSPGSRAPRSVLAVLCVAQFVLILDVAVVNVALVPLAGDLGVAADGLQVVASAYAACFGGVLLLGGRLADGGRRRRTFLAALVLFGVASLVCGAAGSVAVLVAGRAAQGLGAALASPAALSLLTTTFAGAARDRALGTWAAVATAGGAAGLLAGGILTDLAGWRSVFLVNPPIIAAVVLVGLRLLAADRPAAAAPRIPVGPGLAAACAVVLLVGGLGVLEADGPSGLAVAALTGAVVAGTAFALLDRRAAHPLLPPDLLRSRSVLAANGVTALMSAVVLGVNFFLAVHLQGRLGLGPVATGLAFLPITAVSAVSATAAALLVARRGPRPLLVAGMGRDDRGLRPAGHAARRRGLPHDSAAGRRPRRRGHGTRIRRGCHRRDERGGARRAGRSGGAALQLDPGRRGGRRRPARGPRRRRGPPRRGHAPTPRARPPRGPTRLSVRDAVQERQGDHRVRHPVHPDAGPLRARRPARPLLSLPGYGFSDRPTRPGMDVARIAGVVVDVMGQLGYDRFAARGSDLGAGVLQQLALAHPDRLVALHLSGTNPYLGWVPDDLSDAEKAFVAAAEAWNQAEMAYAQEHSSKPQTLAHALNDSPVGLASWVLEKFRAWSDCGGDLDAVYDRADLLTNLTIYCRVS